MASAWGSAFGSAWGSSWGSIAATVSPGSAGGRYRHWTPRHEQPPRKRKKKEEKIAIIEAIVEQPIALIDLSALSNAIKEALALEIPSYASFIREEQKQIREKTAKEKAQERHAEEAHGAIADEIARIEADIERLKKRKAALASKREVNKQILLKTLLLSKLH